MMAKDYMLPCDDRESTNYVDPLFTHYFLWIYSVLCFKEGLQTQEERL